MPRGALIALEGLDRSGKSTQCALLSQHGGIRTLKYPDRTSSTGQVLNAFLTSSTPMSAEAIHLLFSANRWESAEAVRGLLAAGVTVVVDRYVYSGIAFSVARGLDYAWCRAPDVGLVKPDAVVFIDVPEEVQRGRGGFGGERYETVEMQRKVRGVFERMRGEEGEGWWVVDGDGTVEEVQERVWGVVESVVKEVESNGREIGVFR